MAVVRHKEHIHSGHFMVSEFEAEAHDDIGDLAIQGAEEGSNEPSVAPIVADPETVENPFKNIVSMLNSSAVTQGNAIIDVPVTKLFQCMSIAYRQKLTSPKWNRFRGMKLRWKDKIRLNNVIWRCWHMQFIKGHRKLVCAFANPLEIDNHNKTEGGAILEGKYWKRKLATVTAEYKKWRAFHKYQNPSNNSSQENLLDLTQRPYSLVDGSKDDVDLESMMQDADFFVDALFNSLESQQVQFPDPREIRQSSNADFIQPGLVQLQPNLDDLMDLDPMAPLHDWLTTRHQSEYYAGSQSTNVHLQRKQKSNDQSFPSAMLPDHDFGGHQYESSCIAGGPPGSGRCDPAPMGNSVIHLRNSKPIHLGESMRLKKSPETSTLYSSVPVKVQKRSAEVISRPYPYESNHQLPVIHDPRKIASTSGVCQETSTIQYARKPAHCDLLVNERTRNHDQLQSRIILHQQQQIESRTHQHHEASRNHDVQDRARHHSEQSRAEPPSELVQLLQEGHGRGKPKLFASKLIQRAPNSRIREIVQYEPHGVKRFKYNADHPLRPDDDDDLSYNRGSSYGSSSSQAKIVPPPPPGSMPQPVFDMGSHHGPTLQDDTKPLHINAEQKRRCTIKNGFDFLRALVPSLAQTPNVKISKAALLHKGAEYVTQLRDEREQVKQEVEGLRRTVELLNKDIAARQAQLPNAGSAPNPDTKPASQLPQLFDSHVAACTMQNWKYWIFSLIMKPLLDSYDRTVSSSSYEDLARTASSWLDQHASLVQLRPVALESLKQLSTSTEILSEPHKMPHEALNAVAAANMKNEAENSNLNIDLARNLYSIIG